MLKKTTFNSRRAAFIRSFEDVFAVGVSLPAGVRVLFYYHGEDSWFDSIGPFADDAEAEAAALEYVEDNHMRLKSHEVRDESSCPSCGSEYGWNGQTCSDCGHKEAIMARKTAKYILEDTYGAPQAGSDSIEFDEWHEVEEYLDKNPDVMERIENDYATIYEASRSAQEKCPECGEEPCVCKEAGAFGPGSDKIDELRDVMGTDAVLDAICQCLSEDELERAAESIAQDWDFELTAGFGDWQDTDWVEERSDYFKKEWSDGTYADVEKIVEDDGSYTYLWFVYTYDGSPIMGFGECDSAEQAMMDAERSREDKLYVNQERYDNFMALLSSRKADRGDKLQALLNEYCYEFGLMGSAEEKAVGDFLDWLYMTGKKADKMNGKIAQDYRVDTQFGTADAFIDDEGGVFTWCVVDPNDESALIDFDGEGKPSREEAEADLLSKYVEASRKAELTWPNGDLVNIDLMYDYDDLVEAISYMKGVSKSEASSMLDSGQLDESEMQDCIDYWGLKDLPADVRNQRWNEMRGSRKTAFQNFRGGDDAWEFELADEMSNMLMDYGDGEEDSVVEDLKMWLDERFNRAVEIFKSGGSAW